MAKLRQELLVITPNQVGTLAKISKAVAAAGVNIEAICAYVAGGEGHFRIITSNKTKAKSAIESLGFKTAENEVVTVELENKVGAAKELAEKLAGAEIDLKSIYGSTGDAGLALLVFTADNNQKAMDLIG